MAQESSKVLGVTVYLPMYPALEMFRESGDFSISEFPSTLKLTECIAEAIGVGHIKNGNCAKPVFIHRNTNTEKLLG